MYFQFKAFLIILNATFLSSSISDIGVDFLANLAKLTGTTYELINILIFIIGYPVFVFILFGIIYWQYKKILYLKKNYVR